MLLRFLYLKSCLTALHEVLGRKSTDLGKQMRPTCTHITWQDTSEAWSRAGQASLDCLIKRRK